ncbi:MAG TPA: RNA 2',3'-cyclic phosphodiesterase [Candidatus Dormibacteraeota bacterium]|nr:RNA 2',3'-cyclic phosphodiesterase [Candidatus Dormibacteraeota bacterium]
MRLFVALEIPAEVRTVLAALIGEFRGLAPQVKWVRAENLHLTLKFIGETESAKLDAIRAALAEVRSSYALAMLVQGLGFFPDDQRPRVLWAGTRAPDHLAQLAMDTDAVLASLGFPREGRPLAPHLTLARLAGTRLPEPLREAIQRDAARAFGAWQASEFHLMESRLKPAGAEYTTVQSFPFVSEN